LTDLDYLKELFDRFENDSMSIEEFVYILKEYLETGGQ
jgi:hypothetical protein